MTTSASRAETSGSGATLVSPGDVLTPARLGALAACGIESVLAHRPPRVTIVVTGTELRPPGDVLTPGQIYESNGVMLAAVMEAAGATVVRLAATEDTEEAHAASLEEALASDVVVTSGGVSVGPHDLVRRVQARLGVEEVFWGVAMRPGKPLAFGCRGRTLVFGLPGNPVSALVGSCSSSDLRCSRSRVTPIRRRRFGPAPLRRRFHSGPSATISSGRG